MRFKIKLIILFVLVFGYANAQFFSGSQTNFGKNRVQYKSIDWNFYQFQNFDVYYYQGGENLALFTAKNANSYIREMQKVFDFKPESKLQFIVYTNLAEFEQSNIGLEGTEQYNIGGVTKVIGSKVLFYFDGNYYNFQKQIKKGLARVFVDQLIYGGDIKDMVKNSTLIHFPNWYIEGLVSFLSEDWNTENDNFLQDGILSNRFLKFNTLTDKELVLAGHSLWKYIADKYGKKVISDIIYMSEISRDIDGGFMFVLGYSTARLKREWFYAKQIEFQKTLDSKTLPSQNNLYIKAKRGVEVTQIRLNKLATKLAYVSNNSGKFKVKIVDLETKKESKIYSRGFKQNEFKFYESPLIAWNPNGESLMIVDRKKLLMEQYVYSLDSKKTTKKTLNELSSVTSVNFSEKGDKILVSAVKNGQSDIFEINTATTNIKQLTDDIYTDTYPFYTDAKNIVFSSDRVTDSNQTYYNYIPNKNLDLYSLKVKSKQITRLTKSKLNSKIQTQNYFGNTILLANNNGVNNYYKLITDSVVTADTSYANFSINPVSNYVTSALNYSVVSGSKKYAELLYQNGKYHIYVNDSLSLKPKVLQNTTHKKRVLKGVQATKNNDSLLPDTRINTDDQIIISVDNIIINDKSERAKTGEFSKPDSLRPNVIPTNNSYKTVFFADYLMSQLDNTLINENYQIYNPNFPEFFNPGLNGFFKIGISDLFEDKKLVGGFKMSVDLAANEYLASYINLKKRIDKQFTIQRQATFQFDEDLLFGNRIHIHNAKALFRYPFSRISSVSLAGNFRIDRKVDLPDNNTTLAMPIKYTSWTGVKAEYIFDNTVKKALNINFGTRAKAHFEAFKDLSVSKGMSYIFGVDARKYTKLFKEVILANRFASGTSFGNQKLVYYLGGVDGWLTPNFIPTTEIPIDNNQNYIYQTIVTNMRGFAQNIRNGNSYAVLNTEVRVPIIKLFSENPVASDFFHNLQVIGFYDLGTAWTGLHPYAEENSLNVKVIEKTPVTITIDNNLDPIVQGYGFGVRSRLGGYFIRADWSFGAEQGKDINNQFYFSLGLDF